MSASNKSSSRKMDNSKSKSGKIEKKSVARERRQPNFTNVEREALLTAYTARERIFKMPADAPNFSALTKQAWKEIANEVSKFIFDNKNI